MSKESNIAYTIIASIFTLTFIIFFFATVITINGPDRAAVLGFTIPILLFLIFVWINLNNKKAIKILLSIFSSIITIVFIGGIVGTILEIGKNTFIPSSFVAEMLATAISVIGLIVFFIEFLVLKNK